MSNDSAQPGLAGEVTTSPLQVSVKTVNAVIGRASPAPIFIADSDAQAGTITVTLQPNGASLATSGTAGTITGGGAQTLRISGTLSQVNSDLQLLTVTPATTGSLGITVTAEDSNRHAL